MDERSHCRPADGFPNANVGRVMAGQSHRDMGAVVRAPVVGILSKPNEKLRLTNNQLIGSQSAESSGLCSTSLYGLLGQCGTRFCGLLAHSRPSSHHPSGMSHAQYSCAGEEDSVFFIKSNAW